MFKPGIFFHLHCWIYAIEHISKGWGRGRGGLGSSSLPFNDISLIEFFFYGCALLRLIKTGRAVDPRHPVPSNVPSSSAFCALCDAFCASTSSPAAVSSPQGSVNFKFGVLYAKDGQLTDDEMFSNGRCPLHGSHQLHSVDRVQLPAALICSVFVRND